jgi:hypothetical protein
VTLLTGEREKADKIRTFETPDDGQVQAREISMMLPRPMPCICSPIERNRSRRIFLEGAVRKGGPGFSAFMPRQIDRVEKWPAEGGRGIIQVVPGPAKTIFGLPIAERLEYRSRTLSGNMNSKRLASQR